MDEQREDSPSYGRLSTAQLAIWFAQKLDPESPAYNIGVYIEITGAIDPEHFGAAVRAVLDRFDTLHLRFVDFGEGPRQYVAPVPWVMPYFDFSAEAEPYIAAKTWMRDDMARACDLADDPLYNFVLFKANKETYLFYLRFHHIISDGFSKLLLARKVAECYSSLLGAGPPEVQAPCSWLDVLNDEESYRNSESYRLDRDYWLAQLNDPPRPATLSGKPPASIPGFEVISHIDCLAYPVVEALRTLGAAHGASLARVMVAVVALYLHRLTGERDIVVGMPVTARISAKMRDIPGMLSNTLPLRLTIDPDHNFGEFLDQTLMRIQDGLQHQRYRVEDMLHDLGLRSNESELYGMAVNVMPSSDVLSFAGNPARILHNFSEGFEFELSLKIYNSKNASDSRFEFKGNPLHYSEASLIMHMRRLLAFISRLAVAELETPVSRLSLLDESERRTVLYEWNATEAKYPGDKCIHELFEAQAAKFPGAVAVMCEDRQLTYAELNFRANRLARHLRKLGVVPDALVAICAKPGLHMIVGLLGILKAGGAYVPLDPVYPRERLAFMLEDAAPMVLLAEAGTESVLAGLAEAVPGIDLAADAALWEEQSGADLTRRETGVAPGHPAYVIYTSGSTGQPKGVMIEHRGVCNQIVALNAHYYSGVCIKDRILQFASINFDASVQEIFVTLHSGATLVLRTDAWLTGANAFWALCEKYRITVADLPTLFWQYVTQDDQVTIPATLRALIISGEVVSSKALKDWFKRDDYRPRLFIAYGPTETTVNAAIHEPLPDSFSSQSIGRPIANTRIYMLDAYGEPVPIGVEGELYIGGVGVARGYLGRPALTAERFLADPFAGEAGARMYKTGDLGRWLPDGTIEFLGRNDFQVKIRGFRIELSEIEARLVEHPAVNVAVVQAREDILGDKRLVAYYTGAKGVRPETLRAHLSVTLPDYMVPAVYVRLEALPLMPNGKLDRQALPAPKDESCSSRAYEAPQGEIEQTLACIWAELLGVECVGRHDNFFELGGHSLLAITMLSKIDQAFQCRLPLATVFTSPTVEQMARLLRGQEKLPYRFSMFPIQQAGSRPVLFWIGYNSEYSEVLNRMGDNQPVYGFRYGIGAPKEHRLKLPPIESLAAHYIEELLLFQPKGPYFLVGHSFFGVVAFEMAQQLKKRGERDLLLVLIDTYVPKPSYIVYSFKDLFIKLIHLTRNEMVNLLIVLAKKINRKIRLYLHPPIYSPDTAFPSAIVNLLLDNYSPKAYSGRVVLFKAMEMKIGIFEKGMFKFVLPPEYGWRQLIGEELVVYETPGTHLSMLKGKGSALIAHMITDYANSALNIESLP